MRKLKLQMQLSADGMVATQRGHVHFFNWDEEVKQYSIANAANVDCILLGRKTAMGFVPHWKSAAVNPKDIEGKLVAFAEGATGLWELNRLSPAIC
jgi:hypothetical protein